jgi:thioredoxin-like negative regulator of GroEL
VLDDINEDIDEMSTLNLVKTNDKDVATEYGINVIPALIFFDSGMPNVYRGNLLDSDKVLEWLAHLAKEDNIEEVNVKMLEKLIEENDKDKAVVVYIYHDESDHDASILLNLETIDDDLEDINVHLVKFVDINGSFAEKHGVEIVPALVLFNGNGGDAPLTFHGDLGSEHKAVDWVKKVLKDDDNEDDD